MKPNNILLNNTNSLKDKLLIIKEILLGTTKEAIKTALEDFSTIEKIT
jgi:hypothetical protein